MQRRELKLGGRFPQAQQHNAKAADTARRNGVLVNKRARSAQRNLKLPFVPPEDWHEPKENGKGFRVVIQPPGTGFRHILTPQDVRERLADFPQEAMSALEVVQFSRMTRKKQSFPC